MTDGNQYFNRPGPRLVDSAEIRAECLHSGVLRLRAPRAWMEILGGLWRLIRPAPATAGACTARRADRTDATPPGASW